MILRTVDRRKEAQKRGPYGRGLAFVFLAALSWGGIVPPAHAQPPDSSRAMPKVDRVKQAQELAAYRAGVGNARKLAMANNVAGAEQALTAVNKSKPNTASWHMETAQRLMQTAEYLRREAKPAAVPALAASALNHLTQADGLTKDVRDRAAAKCLVGLFRSAFWQIGPQRSPLIRLPRRYPRSRREQKRRSRDCNRQNRG